MKYCEWINTKVDLKDIICGCTDPGGFDADNPIYPLGCHTNFNDFKETEDIEIFTTHPEVNTKLLFYSFRHCTDTQRNLISQTKNMSKRKVYTRLDFKNILDKTYEMKSYLGDEYFRNIGKYKFVISPTGNGLDCYRHYETWLSKGIPIIEYNSFIEKKYNMLPILWTRDYSEINDNYLNTQYEKFLDKDYDFRRVLLTKYSNKIQKEIKLVCENHTINNLGLRDKQFWKFSDYFFKVSTSAISSDLQSGARYKLF